MEEGILARLEARIIALDQKLETQNQNFKTSFGDLNQKFEDLSEHFQFLKRRTRLLSHAIQEVEERSPLIPRASHDYDLVREPQLMPTSISEYSFEFRPDYGPGGSRRGSQ